MVDFKWKLTVVLDQSKGIKAYAVRSNLYDRAKMAFVILSHDRSDRMSAVSVLSPRSRSSKRMFAVPILLVEPQEVLNILFRAEENGATLVNAGGLDVQNALLTGGSQTARLSNEKDRHKERSENEVDERKGQKVFLRITAACCGQIAETASADVRASLFAGLILELTCSVRKAIGKAS